MVCIVFGIWMAKKPRREGGVEANVEMKLRIYIVLIDEHGGDDIQTITITSRQQQCDCQYYVFIKSRERERGGRGGEGKGEREALPFEREVERVVQPMLNSSPVCV